MGMGDLAVACWDKFSDHNKVLWLLELPFEHFWLPLTSFVFGDFLTFFAEFW